MPYVDDEDERYAEDEDAEMDEDDDLGSDWDREDDNETVPCPYCRAEVYEEAVRCPRCGKYLSEEDAPPRRHPWWIILGFLACLAAAVLWVLGG